MKDLRAENNILSRGVALRDESVEMMRAELQASAEMLQGAADNREVNKGCGRGAYQCSKIAPHGLNWAEVQWV